MARASFRPVIAATLASLGLVAGAGLARAAPGFVTQNINMRAGPDVAYPLVASLPQGTPVEIYGCLPGWTWCDTQAGPARGWVAGVGLQVLYQQEPEPLVTYGGAIGLPFIGFDFGSYWGSYYRGRPWYSHDDRWHGPGFHGPGPGFGPGRGPGFERPGERPGFDRGPGARGPGPGPWQGGPIHGGPAPENHPGGPGGFRGPGPGPRPGGPGPGAEHHGPAGGPPHGAPGGEHRGPDDHHPN